jgi:hypothetical protein
MILGKEICFYLRLWKTDFKRKKTHLKNKNTFETHHLLKHKNTLEIKNRHKKCICVFLKSFVRLREIQIHFSGTIFRMLTMR